MCNRRGQLQRGGGGGVQYLWLLNVVSVCLAVFPSLSLACLNFVAFPLHFFCACMCVCVPGNGGF